MSLWELVPTPRDAVRIRENAVAKVLTAHRIRRFDAEHVLHTLHQEPLTVAPGTTEAATAHISSLAGRIRLVDQQLKDAHRKLDVLTDAPGRGASGLTTSIDLV